MVAMFTFIFVGVAVWIIFLLYRKNREGGGGNIFRPKDDDYSRDYDDADDDKREKFDMNSMKPSPERTAAAKATFMTFAQALLIIVVTFAAGVATMFVTDSTYGPIIVFAVGFFIAAGWIVFKVYRVPENREDFTGWKPINSNKPRSKEDVKLDADFSNIVSSFDLETEPDADTDSSTS